MHIAKDRILGYLYFIDKTHPVANTQGKVYLHRHVWFQNTGINPKGLVIHHIDENKENNDFSNLQALTASAHASLHSRAAGLAYVICKTCNTEFSYPKLRRKRVFCSAKCHASNTRKAVRPPIKELQILVAKLGFRGTGKMFGVSDNAIRKWLNKVA